MKKIFTLAIVIGSFSCAIAQIQITRSDIGSVGDKVYYGKTDTFSTTTPTVGQSGANRTWNFMGFTPSSYDSTIFLDATIDPLAPSGANLVILNSDGIEYLAISDSILQRFVVNDATGEDLIITEMVFPLTFGASGNDTIDLSFITTPADLGFPGLPFDSVWVQIKVIATRTVDAWGEITIPTGTFDALRVFTRTINETNIQVKSDTLPWQPLPFPIPGGIAGSGYLYQWIGKNQKYYLAEVEADSIGKILDLSFQVDRVFANNLSKVDMSVATSIYPNPATNVLNVRLKNATAYSYVLIDINGRTVLKGNNVGEILTLDIALIENGQYIMLVESDGMIASKPVFIRK
jgi:hypothetical protein